MFSAAFATLCTIGLTLHISLISLKYFNYEATSVLSMDTPKKVDMPALSICIRYWDILDHHNLSNVVNETWQDSVLPKNITLQQIFDNTPSSDAIFHDCLIRLPGHYRFEAEVGSNCFRFFKVKKFYTQEYVCYRFQANESVYDYDQVSTAFLYSGSCRNCVTTLSITIC